MSTLRSSQSGAVPFQENEKLCCGYLRAGRPYLQSTEALLSPKVSLRGNSVPLSFLYGPENISGRKAALIVGHPGHELKVFGWLTESAPRVYVLTDGSGANGISRLSSTTKLLHESGSVADPIFGFISDAGVYRAIIGQEVSTFLAIVDRLAASLGKHGIELVAGDAVEGFNPTHDICRALLNAAVPIANRSSGRTIANYEFCLTEWEQHCQDPHDSRCVHLRLDDQLLQQKLRAAREYKELRNEVQQAIAARGEEYFRVECLRKVTDPFPELFAETKPYYEMHGEQRVAQGKYESVIRYREHMLPILKAIREYTEARCNSAHPAVPAGSGAAATFRNAVPAAIAGPT